MIETSRAYQRRLVAPVTPLSDELRRVLMEGKKYFPVSSTVACQGVEGSYSSIALLDAVLYGEREQRS